MCSTFAWLQQRQSINVPITADKVFHLGALGIRVLAKQVHLDVPTCLAMFAGHCGAIAVAPGRAIIHQLELHVASAAEKHLNRDLYARRRTVRFRWRLAILIQRHSYPWP